MHKTSQNNYAELDLIRVNSSSYNQTTFRIEVHALFQQPDDGRTWAAIIFQTPADGPGGYIFGVTSQGQWRLQKIAPDNSIQLVDISQISPIASQPVTIAVQVQNGAAHEY